MLGRSSKKEYPKWWLFMVMNPMGKNPWTKTPQKITKTHPRKDLWWNNRLEVKVRNHPVETTIKRIGWLGYSTRFRILFVVNWTLNNPPLTKSFIRSLYPIGSMGLVYTVHLHEWLIFMVDVAKYTIHGSYGYCKLPNSCKMYLWLGHCQNSGSQWIVQGFGNPQPMNPQIGLPWHIMLSIVVPC